MPMVRTQLPTNHSAIRTQVLQTIDFSRMSESARKTLTGKLRRHGLLSGDAAAVASAYAEAHGCAFPLLQISLSKRRNYGYPPGMTAAMISRADGMSFTAEERAFAQPLMDHAEVLLKMWWARLPPPTGHEWRTPECPKPLFYEGYRGRGGYLHIPGFNSLSGAKILELVHQYMTSKIKGYMEACEQIADLIDTGNPITLEAKDL